MWEKCPDNPDPPWGGVGSKKIHQMYGNELFDKRSNGAIILTTNKDDFGRISSGFMMFGGEN